MSTIFTGVREILNVVFICISLIDEDVEFFFHVFFVTCTSSFEKCLFNTYNHLLIGLFAILEFNFGGTLLSFLNLIIVIKKVVLLWESDKNIPSSLTMIEENLRFLTESFPQLSHQ
jgi:hypothetical protein